MSAFAVYLLLFLAGIAWGLGAGFGRALFAREGSEAVWGAGDLRRTFAAALATGFGGSGATLTHAGRWSAGLNLVFALLAGLLFAALVATATHIVLEEEKRVSTSP